MKLERSIRGLSNQIRKSAFLLGSLGSRGLGPSSKEHGSDGHSSDGHSSDGHSSEAHSNNGFGSKGVHLIRSACSVLALLGFLLFVVYLSSSLFGEPPKALKTPQAETSDVVQVVHRAVHSPVKLKVSKSLTLQDEISRLSDSLVVDSSAAEEESARLPEWIGKGDFKEADSTIQLVSVESDKGIRDCERLLNASMLNMVDEYLADNISRRAPEFVVIDPRLIRSELLVAEHKVVVESPSGGHRIYAQLRFDKEFHLKSSREWQRAQQKHRLANLGILASVAFSFLTLVFAYFRLNHATRGFYAGRLQFLTGVAILAMAIGSLFALRSVPWI